MEKQLKKDNLLNAGAYNFGLGRRKTASARVRLYFDAPKESKGVIIVNNKSFDEYFPNQEQKANVYKPLEICGIKKSDLMISLRTAGGGRIGQAEAARLAIARALVAKDENLKSLLRSAGFLTRDPRMRERKKPGLKRARRASQWVKR